MNADVLTEAVACTAMLGRAGIRTGYGRAAPRPGRLQTGHRASFLANVIIRPIRALGRFILREVERQFDLHAHGHVVRQGIGTVKGRGRGRGSFACEANHLGRGQISIACFRARALAHGSPNPCYNANRMEFAGKIVVGI